MNKKQKLAFFEKHADKLSHFIAGNHNNSVSRRETKTKCGVPFLTVIFSGTVKGIHSQNQSLIPLTSGEASLLWSMYAYEAEAYSGDPQAQNIFNILLDYVVDNVSGTVYMGMVD